MEKLLLMLELQNDLNDSTNGKNWKDGITKNNKEINWKRCIYMECAEIIDSFAWKHWKDISKPTDYENIKIEVVDIWHFVMSLAIEVFYKNSKSINEIANEVSKIDEFKQILKNETETKDDKKIILKVEDIMFDVLNKQTFNIKELFKDFFELVFLSGLNLNSLYNLYVGKNILNRFRQENGYKDGTYIKIWNDKEDNEVMQEILYNNPNIKPDQLYTQLNKIYKQL